MRLMIVFVCVIAAACAQNTTNLDGNEYTYSEITKEASTEKPNVKENVHKHSDKEGLGEKPNENEHKEEGSGENAKKNKHKEEGSGKEPKGKKNKFIHTHKESLGEMVVYRDLHGQPETCSGYFGHKCDEICTLLPAYYMPPSACYHHLCYCIKVLRLGSG